MEVVFATDTLPAAQRYSAWRDAICDCYVHVDVRATHPDEYRGFVREARFGDVVLTDILLSEQRIRREHQHIARLDKDCFYVQMVQQGRNEVVQRGASHRSNAARAAIFSAVEPYELRFTGEMRSFYLELPREKFSDRFPRARIPVAATMQTTQGLGRIATEFCATLATQGAGLDEPVRARLGEQLMDILALALFAGDDEVAVAEHSIKEARLRSIQRWIEEHLAEPDLTLEKVAAANQVSLRYLHALFRSCDVSASEWIWTRRLQRSYDALAKGDATSITAVAFQHGFASSAHFSTLFRRRFGVAPREVAQPRGVDPGEGAAKRP